MESKALDKFINLIELPFAGIEWDDKQYQNLDLLISDIETSTLAEIENNLFGKTILVKSDIIRYYVNIISELYYEVLCVNFRDEDYDEDDIYAPNKLVLEKIKSCSQFIIDGICVFSHQNNVNLIKIIEGNPITHLFININLYHEKIRVGMIEKGTRLNLLKEMICTPEGLDLFYYLVKNFDTKYTEHNKFSCLYRKLTADGHLSEDLKPEQFKTILKSSQFNADIKFALLSENKLSGKILKHYNILKESFYKSV
jgi:hypothetical protein